MGIDEKIVPVSDYEAIRGAFDSKGGRRSQRSISTTVNGNRSTSHLCQVNVRRMGPDGRDRNGDRPRNDR